MRTFFTIILLVAASLAYGQTSPQITVSTEKIKVNGEIMLVHKVKSGETLYSISKAYNVTQDEIVRRNESLKSGLKEGSTIYIPSSSATTTSENTKTNTPKNTSAAEEHSSGLKIPDIFGKKKEKNGAVTLSQGGYDIKQYSKKKHTVKWYEKIEDVAAKYKVPVDAIVELNALESTLIKKKQILYIPNETFIELISKSGSKEEDVTPEPVEETPVTEEVIQEETTLPLFEKGKIELTYILPLKLNDSIGPDGNFMDFYAGAMLAVEKIAQSTNDKITVNVIDQMQYGSAERMIASGAIEGKNCLIGPIRPADMEKVLKATGKHSIVVSPIDQGGERLVEGNSSFYQAPPAAIAQQNNLTDLFAKKFTSEKNAVLVYEDGGADTSLVRITKELLASKGIEYRTLSYGILQGREILGKMGSYMKQGTENLVMVISNSEAFVSDVVRNLNLICTNPSEERRRDITLFGLPRWRNFETIEVDYFHRMNLHLSLPYFVDYNTPQVKDFLLKYRGLYNGEPTPFAFQGYDVTLHTFSLIKGNSRPQDFKSIQMNGEYIIKSGDNGNGHINCATKQIVYNKDYTISELK